MTHMAASCTSFIHLEVITVNTSSRTCTVSPEPSSSPQLSFFRPVPVQVVLRLGQAWLHWSHTLTQITRKFLAADNISHWDVLHFHCSTFIIHSILKKRTLITHQYSRISSTPSTFCLQIRRWDDAWHGTDTDPAEVLWVPVASWELERVQSVCLSFHGDPVQLLSLWPSGGTSGVMSLSGKDGAKWQAELWDCWPTHFGRTLSLTTKKRQPTGQSPASDSRETWNQK